MLRETKCYRIYPNKSIVEDLITREGPATENDFTPFIGKRDVIESQFSGSQKHKYKEKDFIAFSRNRDLNPSVVKIPEKDGMLATQAKKLAGWRTLEDMIINGTESTSVKDYLVMLCVGFKKDSESPYKKTNEFYTRVVSYPGDDDNEATEEKYLLERNDEKLSNEDYEEIIRELPYIIKSIWSYSKQYKGNLFSFIFAYADILEHKRSNRNDVIIQDFRFYNTYCINSDGTFRKQFSHADDNKYTIYPAITKIFIAPGSHQAEYNLCMKFLNYLNVLGIDYHDEDPLQFNNDFMRRLVCTYLPGNEQYIKEYKDIDPEIIVALSPENVFATIKSALYVPVENRGNTYDYTQSIYFISEAIDLAHKMAIAVKDTELFKDRTKDVIALITEYLKVYTGDKNVVAPVKDIYFHPQSGICYLKSESKKNRVQDYLKVPGKFFGEFKNDDNYKVIFTKYGFIIALEEEYDRVYYMTLDDCFDALEDYNNHESNSRKKYWHPLGVFSQ